MAVKDLVQQAKNSRLGKVISTITSGVRTVAQPYAQSFSQSAQQMGSGVGGAIRAPIDMYFNNKNAQIDNRVADTLRSQQQGFMNQGNFAAARNRSQLIAGTQERIASRQVGMGQQMNKDRTDAALGTAGTALQLFGAKGIGVGGFAGATAVTGGLGYGITRAMGGSNDEALAAAGSGAGKALQYRGINKISDKFFTNPLMRGVGQQGNMSVRVGFGAGVNALANIGEDQVLTRVNEGRAPTGQEIAQSGAVGAVMGGFSQGVSTRQYTKQIEDNQRQLVDLANKAVKDNKAGKALKKSITDYMKNFDEPVSKLKRKIGIQPASVVERMYNDLKKTGKVAEADIADVRKFWGSYTSSPKLAYHMTNEEIVTDLYRHARGTLSQGGFVGKLDNTGKLNPDSDPLMAEPVKPVIADSSLFLRPGQNPIGENNNSDSVARERFDIPKLKKISFGGSDRDVYDLGDKVLKVAKTARGLAQNSSEGERFAPVPKSFEAGKNYVVVEKVSKPDAATKKLVKDLNEAKDFNSRTPAVDMINKVASKYIDSGDPKLEEIGSAVQDLNNYEVMLNDLTAIRNWGTDADGMPSLLDAGSLNTRVIDDYKGVKNLDDPEFRDAYNQSKQAKKKFGDMDNNTMYGAAAGMETYQDEEGNWQVRFNPAKAAMGIGVMGGVKAIKNGNLQFDGNYQRGDIKTLQTRLDDILGTKSFNFSGKWQAELPARQLAVRQIESYAEQGDADAIKYLSEIRSIEDQLANAQIARTQPKGTSQPGIQEGTPLETKITSPLDNASGIRSLDQGALPGQKLASTQELPQRTPNQMPKGQSTNEPALQMDTVQFERLPLEAQKQLETKKAFLQGQSQPYFNTKNYRVNKESKNLIKTTVSEVKPAIEKLVGKKLTNNEVIEKANITSKLLNTAVSRDQTEAWEAALLKTRQKLSSLSESGVVDQEYIDTLINIKSLGTDIGRKLQSFGIGADPQMVTSKQAILEAVTKVETDTNKVLKAAQGVDFNDLKQATEFYRKFVKPNLEEKLDLLRYNSMLSSPNTHINNAFSNFQGTGIIAPLEKTIAGGVDAIRAIFNRQPRTRFAGEGVAYAKGYYSNLDKAMTAFTDVMRGKSLTNAPDMRNIPLYPDGRGAKYEKILSFPMKVLEATDQLFTALTEAGSKASLNYRLQNGVSKGMNIESLARDEAARRLFRSDLGDNNGSLALNAIDIIANKVQSLKGSENLIVRTIAKYSLPFLRTPTNVLKQAVEYTPFGVFALPGSKDKTDQVAKILLGGSIGAGLATLVGGDRLTWAEPTGVKQKQAFKAAGLQAYSVKIGNNWVSYSKLHPAISFNFAFVAAIRNAEENKTLDDGQIETLLQGAAKWVNFFADQSYMKNIGDIVSATKGDVEGMAKIPSNYTQQFVPFRALMGWVSRLTDPYQRQVDPDGSFLEKQLGYLATQIPGLSQSVPARLDQFGNPIPNQNRGLNAISPLRVTTENPVAKEDYDFIKEKAKLEKEKRYLKTQLKNEVQENVTAPKVGASDSEYIQGTGLRKLTDAEKDRVDTYLEFGKAVTREQLENKYLGDLSTLPSSNRYQTSIRKKDFLAKLSTIENDEKLSEEQKTVLKVRIASELKLKVNDLENYVIASGTNDEKTLHAYDQIDKSKSFDDTMRYLVNGRKPINGKMLVSDGVIDNLVADGVIPYALGKDIKEIDLNEDGSRKGKIKARSSRRSRGGRSSGRSSKKSNTAQLKAFNDLGEDLKKIKIGTSKIRTTQSERINTKGLTFSGA